MLTVSVTLAISFIYFQTKGVVEAGNYRYSHEIVAQLTEFDNEKFKNTINYSQAIFQDSTFQTAIGDILWNSSYNYAVESSTLDTLFQNLKLKDSYVDSVLLYTSNGVFSDNSYQIRPEFQMLSSALYAGFQRNHSIYWASGGPSEIFEENAKVVPIVLNTTIDNVGDRAILVVNLKYDALAGELEDVGSANNASVFILNTDHSVVAAYDRHKVDAILDRKPFLSRLGDAVGGSFNYAFRGGNLYINYGGIGINGWTVVMVQPQSEVFKGFAAIQLGMLLIGLVSITLMSILSHFAASTMIRPLTNLNQTIDLVDRGNLNVRFDSAYTDEISRLGNHFNEMLDSIQSLFLNLEQEQARTQEEQRQKVRAELRALQEQINPHFLYNTLDSIYWKSQIGETAKVGDMIISLSRLLRIGLSKGNDRIPASQEVEHVRNYLFLQKCMYPDKFEYEIRAQGDLSRYNVIKILLQPLVENSLLHGFDHVDYRGRITVEARPVDGALCLTVRDNGCGMDAEAVMRSLREDTPTSGYALKNLYRRIRLSYGDAGGMNIQSTPFHETSVELRIPLEEL